MSQINRTSPTTFTTGLLIGDASDTGVPPTLTTPGSIAFEVQSTLGALLLPRMTTAQRDAGTFVPVNGSVIYNTTTSKANFYQSSAWVSTASLTSDGDLFLGTIAAIPGTATNSLVIQSGTAPTGGIADNIIVYSSDVSAGNTTLSVYTEGTPISATTITSPDKSLALRVNGTLYYLPCKLTNN